MMTVKTPFGIGFATDQADYEKMMMFVEGAKAMMEFMGAHSTVDEDMEDEDDMYEDDDDDEYMEDETDIPEPVNVTDLDRLVEKVDKWCEDRGEYTSRELWRKVDREIRENFPDISDQEAEDYVYRKLNVCEI